MISFKKESCFKFTLPDIRDEIIPLLARRVSAKVVLPIEMKAHENILPKFLVGLNKFSFSIYHDQRVPECKNFLYFLYFFGVQKRDFSLYYTLFA